MSLTVSCRSPLLLYHTAEDATERVSAGPIMIDGEPVRFRVVGVEDLMTGKPKSDFKKKSAATGQELQKEVRKLPTEKENEEPKSKVAKVVQEGEKMKANEGKTSGKRRGGKRRRKGANSEETC